MLKSIPDSLYLKITQENPIGMAIYGIVLTPSLNSLIFFCPEKGNRLVTFVNNLTFAGSTVISCSWWTNLLAIGQKFGQFPKATKTILNVTPTFEDNAKEIFSNTNIRITSSAEKQLGMSLLVNQTIKKTLVILNIKK